MCVNDLLAQGAEPLLFLDYYASAKLEIETARAVIAGIAEGCRLAGAALVGGETAEMPGLYAGGDYDLAGFALGAVERGRVLPELNAQACGDLMIGLAASGAHANGFSLIRRIVEASGADLSAPAPFDSSRSLAEALLAPTRIYVASVLPLLKRGLVKGAAHITGGGLVENPPRAVRADLIPRIDFQAWTSPPVFAWLQQTGRVADAEMRRTFNCGVGFVLIVSPQAAPEVLAHLLESGETAFVIGELAAA
jgi:phosphoribosylaminoimidazole synthetase